MTYRSYGDRRRASPWGGKNTQPQYQPNYPREHRTMTTPLAQRPPRPVYVDPTAAARVAARLGIPASEVAAVAEHRDGELVTTADGQQYLFSVAGRLFWHDSGDGRRRPDGLKLPVHQDGGVPAINEPWSLAELALAAGREKSTNVDRSILPQWLAADPQLMPVRAYARWTELAEHHGYTLPEAAAMVAEAADMRTRIIHSGLLAPDEAAKL